MTDAPLPDDVRVRIERYLHSRRPSRTARTITPLTPDASDRRYFRLADRSGTTSVVAVHAGPIDFSTLPFANVAELFSRIPLPVPAILGHSDEEGIVELDDLGDLTLQAHIDGAGDAVRFPIYREAVAYLALLQTRGEALRSTRYLPFGLAFDVEKLMWELDFFVHHFLIAYRGAQLSPEDRAAFADEWRALSVDLASEPRVLCHRDYHSRNLMVTSRGLAIIDFQDARLGPIAYDLASLLRDSYVDLSDQLFEELLAHFCVLARVDDRRAFRERFDLMSVQRNLKALGTFGFQATTRRNPAYIPYMSRTLAYVRSNLGKYHRFDRLQRLLSPHLPEWG